MGRLAIGWVIGFGLYLLFTGQPSAAEFCAAAIMTTVAASLILFIQRQGSVAMKARAPWGRLTLRLGKSIAVDSVLIARSLVASIGGNAVRGSVMKQPFQPGPIAPVSNARRGIVILLGSLAPNGFIVELDRAGPALVIHRLVAEPRSSDEQWPV